MPVYTDLHTYIRTHRNVHRHVHAYTHCTCTYSHTHTHTRRHALEITFLCSCISSWARLIKTLLKSAIFCWLKLSKSLSAASLNSLHAQHKAQTIQTHISSIHHSFTVKKLLHPQSSPWPELASLLLAHLVQGIHLLLHCCYAVCNGHLGATAKHGPEGEAAPLLSLTLILLHLRGYTQTQRTSYNNVQYMWKCLCKSKHQILETQNGLSGPVSDKKDYKTIWFDHVMDCIIKWWIASLISGLHHRFQTRLPTPLFTLLPHLPCMVCLYNWRQPYWGLNVLLILNTWTTCIIRLKIIPFAKNPYTYSSELQAYTLCVWAFARLIYEHDNGPVI